MELAQQARSLGFKNCYQVLQGQEYKHIPIHLNNVIDSMVSRTAAVLYGYILHFYNLQLATGENSGVSVSIKRLSNLAGRSPRHTSRCLSELVDGGFLIRELRYKRPNTYFLAIPERIQHELLNKPIRKTKRAANDKVYSKGASFKTNASGGVAIDMVPNAIAVKEQQQVYEKYHNKVKELENVLGPLKANLQAFNMLSNAEKTIYHQIVDKIKTETSRVAYTSHPACVTKDDIFVTHNINNIYCYNSGSAVDNSAKQQGYRFSKNEVVNLNKKITPEHTEKSIRKFIEQSPIPEIVFRNKEIVDVVEEVKFHVLNRNPDKTKSALHALNAAKAMLKAGIWTTPKRYVWLKTQESIYREQCWLKYKQQESEDAKRFFNRLNE
jgi:hypothetical protein